MKPQYPTSIVYHLIKHLSLQVYYITDTCDISIDIDECAVSSPCCNGGSCVNNPGSFSCSCALGWTGTVCEKGITGTFY